MAAKANVTDEILNDSMPADTATATGVLDPPETGETDEPGGAHDGTTDADWDEANDVQAPEGADTAVAQREDHEQLIHAAETGQVIDFDTDELVADPERNGRFKERKITDESVKDLAKQIAIEGQMQPGEVLYGLDNRLYVNYGVGRFLAVSSLNSSFEEGQKRPFKATVVLEKAEDPTHAFIRNAMENWGRLELTPLDKSLIIGKLLNAGLKQAQICEKLGLKKASVSMLATAAGWPEEVTQAIAEDKISLKAVYELGIKEPEKLKKEVGKLVTEAEAAGSKKATVTKANASRAKRDEKDGGKESKQRTAKQILEFIDAEAVDATAKKYGDKQLVAKLVLFGKFVKGMSEGTFLKNLAAL